MTSGIRFWRLIPLAMRALLVRQTFPARCEFVAAVAGYAKRSKALVAPIEIAILVLMPRTRLLPDAQDHRSAKPSTGWPNALDSRVPHVSL